MSLYYYDPFYDLERLVNDAFRTSAGANNTNHAQALHQLEGGVQTFRPR